jgi:hypothetical protein
MVKKDKKFGNAFSVFMAKSEEKKIMVKKGKKFGNAFSVFYG